MYSAVTCLRVVTGTVLLQAIVVVKKKCGKRKTLTFIGLH